MSHCYECLPGLPVWNISYPYICPQSTILVHPVPPFGPANSWASWGINLSTNAFNSALIFIDYVIQAYSPTTAFHTMAYVCPNCLGTQCPNDNTAIYYGTGNVQRHRPRMEPWNVVYTIANGCYNVPGLTNTPAIGTYCWEDVIDGLNAVNDIMGWPLDFTYTMNWQEAEDNMSLYAPGEKMKVESIFCSCDEGPCYCQACTDNFGGTGYPSINCIYSSVDLQLCINSAAAEPCCRKPKHLKKANFNACSEVLGRHLLEDGGAPIKTNNVKYESSLGNYSFGDCVFDPKDEQYKCCTFDGQSDLIYDKTIACRIINGKFTNDYGIWRSCEEQPMLWDCVSNVNSCDEFKNTSEEYIGSFISMSQVDDYYENREPTENISKTHFDLSLSPIDLSLSESIHGWCMSKTHKYTYEPKYNLAVTTPINFACIWNVGCVGPGTYSTTTPFVMAVYPTMAACQADIICALSGGTASTATTLGAQVQMGICDCPNGGCSSQYTLPNTSQMSSAYLTVDNQIPVVGDTVYSPCMPQSAGQCTWEITAVGNVGVSMGNRQSSNDCITATTNFACMGGVIPGNTTCVGPGNYGTGNPNVMAIYSTMAACQADPSCGISGVTNFACMSGVIPGNTICVGPGNYTSGQANVMAIYSTMAACQADLSCGISGDPCCQYCMDYGPGGPLAGQNSTPPVGCYDWMCTNSQWISDNCGPDGTRGVTLNVNIEADSFDEFVMWTTNTYPGININNTMKFSKIKSVVTTYINSSSFCVNNGCSFAVNTGILPKPIQDHQVNCTCKQTISGKYTSKARCISGNSPCEGQECENNCTGIGEGDCYCDNGKCVPIKNK